MKKAAKILFITLLFLVILPTAAGLAISALWNLIVTPACGFATIGLWQGIGLFALSQTLSGGFVIGIFLFAGSLHKLFHRHDGHSHWHAMSDQERRAFIQRRRERWKSCYNTQKPDNDAE